VRALPPAFDGAWLVAHRGAHDVHPENSLAALRRAHDLGLPAELDVRLTRHGELIVFHDDNLDRLTSDRGPVSDLTPAARTALGIPTLADALAAHPGALLIELKRSRGDDADALVRGVVGVAGRQSERVIFMSFDHPTLLLLNHYGPKLTLCRLVGGLGRVAYAPLRRLLRPPSPDTATVGPAKDQLSRRAVARWHAIGTRVFSWTAKSPRDVRRAANLNVDLCIADPFPGYERLRGLGAGHAD
jgi:glycerophosphoryl diester phosphodiesterase